MAFRHPTQLRRSRVLAAGLALVIGFGAAGARAMPLPGSALKPGVVLVHDHDGYGDRGYGRGHHHHRGPERGWRSDHHGWDRDRGYDRRGWGRHHHHHGGDREYDRY